MAHPGGRPTDYNDELALEICETLATSPKMIEELCSEMDGWPAWQTIYKWRIRHLKFGEMYAIAKQQQIEAILSSMMCKVREKANDFVVDNDGKMIPNTPAMQRLRIENDNAKWFACKLAPKIYGEKITIKSDADEKLKELEKAKLIAKNIKDDLNGRSDSTES